MSSVSIGSVRVEKTDSGDTPRVPEWLLELRARASDRYFSRSGHAWIRFHKWAFMRFPPHDLSVATDSEERELFYRAKAAAISTHHLPGAGEMPNAFLYLCSDKEYDIAKLSANNRSKVRRGLKRFTVRRASMSEIAEKGYTCYSDTCLRNGIEPVREEAFRVKWAGTVEPSARETWGVFAGDEIAAMGTVWICGKWAELFSTQSANGHLKDYCNHVLFYEVMRELLSRGEVESVSYGLSSAQPNSKVDSLHHFKLSVNFEAIPVVRQIKVNPILRPVANRITLSGARLIEKAFPRSRHLLAARGALELVVNGY